MERGRNCCLHSQGEHLQPRPTACIAAGSPNVPSESVLGRKVTGCFENAVASDGHGGIAFCFRWMEIKLLLAEGAP